MRKKEAKERIKKMKMDRKFKKKEFEELEKNQKFIVKAGKPLYQKLEEFDLLISFLNFPITYPESLGSARFSCAC